MKVIGSIVKWLANKYGLPLKTETDTQILSLFGDILGEEGSLFVLANEKDVLLTQQSNGRIRIEQFPKGNADAADKANAIGELLELSEGFLDGILEDAIQESEDGHSPFEAEGLSERGASLVRGLVAGFEGEKGRALYVHSVLVCAIKAVYPEQDIRLHKTDWIHGIGMRSIDKNYVSAWFNNRALGVKLNSDGVFMTRSLAVDVPYVPSFPAKLKGEKEAWLELISSLEHGEIDAKSALSALLFGAHLRNMKFNDIVSEIKAKVSSLSLPKGGGQELIQKHIIGRKNGGSRLLELAIHSFVQLCMENSEPIKQFYPSNLAPIKPMRSPDKKAGDVGDIQFRHSTFEDIKGKRFLEYAIDAKYEVDISDSEINRLMTHLDDEATPQPKLRQFDYIGLSKPNISAISPQKLNLFGQGKRYPPIEFLSLSDFVTRIDANGNLDSNWLDRYISLLATEDLGYGRVTEITTDWLTSLLQLIEEIYP